MCVCKWKSPWDVHSTYIRCSCSRLMGYFPSPSTWIQSTSTAHIFDTDAVCSKNCFLWPCWDRIGILRLVQWWTLPEGTTKPETWWQMKVSKVFGLMNLFKVYPTGAGGQRLMESRFYFAEYLQLTVILQHHAITIKTGDTPQKPRISKETGPIHFNQGTIDSAHP